MQHPPSDREKFEQAVSEIVIDTADSLELVSSINDIRELFDIEVTDVIESFSPKRFRRADYDTYEVLENLATLFRIIPSTKEVEWVLDNAKDQELVIYAKALDKKREKYHYQIVDAMDELAAMIDASDWDGLERLYEQTEHCEDDNAMLAAILTLREKHGDRQELLEAERIVRQILYQAQVCRAA